MKTSESISKANSAETRLYEFLGIKLFKKIILLFERVRHLHDNKQNENYHIHSTSVSALRRFSGYLIYNSIFHIASLFLIAVYFTMTRCFFIKNFVFDIIAIIVIVLNLYCLIMQRYTYIKIKKQICKKQQRNLTSKNKCAVCTEELFHDKSPETLSTEFAFLQKMKSDILSEKNIVWDADSEKTLLGIAEVCRHIRKTKTLKNNNTCNDITFKELSDSLPLETRVTTSKQHYVSTLQKALKYSPKNNVMFGVCIITRTPVAESAYRQIFPKSELDSILETTDSLLETYHIHLNETVTQ